MTPHHRRILALLVGVITLTEPALATKSTNTPTTFPGDIPSFVEIAEKAGLDHRYTGPWEYFVGGGISAFDCNGDRRPDLAIAGGTAPARVFVNKSAAGQQLKFQSKPSGLPRRARTGVIGFYPIDLDNDGFRDLVALRVGRNYLLKGRGDCQFSIANEQFGFDGGRAWTTAFAATFERGQKYPTLAFGNYVDRSAPGSPWGTCHANVLLRPKAESQSPLFNRSQALTPGYCALSLLFTDWNRSGTPSLRITNDRQYYRGGQEQLWNVTPSRPAKAYRRADGWRPLKIWGMGIAAADLDADGRPEFILTSMGDTKLQSLVRGEDDGRPTYQDIAFDRGVTAHRPYTGGDPKPSTGWHAEFADFNNDARLDLFISKGNVEAMPDFAAFDPDNLLLGTTSERFFESGAEAGIALNRRGRGASIADFNSDGLLDLVVVNREAPTSLFWNIGTRTSAATRPMGNWLQVELAQPQINLDAVGAQVVVKTGNLTQARTINIGGGHASGRLGFIHFGLGVAERAEIRVRWPDGSWSQSYRVFANNFVIIRRGKENAQYWYPPQNGDD